MAWFYSESTVAGDRNLALFRQNGHASSGTGFWFGTVGTSFPKQIGFEPGGKGECLLAYLNQKCNFPPLPTDRIQGYSTAMVPADQWVHMAATYNFDTGVKIVSTLFEHSFTKISHTRWRRLLPGRHPDGDGDSDRIHSEHWQRILHWHRLRLLPRRHAGSW